MNQFAGFEALISIQQQMGPLKRDLKALDKEVRKLIVRRDIGEDYLYLVVNAINRKEPLSKIKRIAVMGLKKVKE